jgi:hypothetical protein
MISEGIAFPPGLWSERCLFSLPFDSLNRAGTGLLPDPLYGFSCAIVPYAAALIYS